MKKPYSSRIRPIKPLVAPNSTPKRKLPLLVTLQQTMQKVVSKWRIFYESVQRKIWRQQIWLLVIDEAGLTVWRGRIATATFYPANETGVALFKTWLVSTPHRECRVLVDAMNEHYVTERIAKLNWLDRQAILERHRQRQFPNKRFSTVNSLGLAPQLNQEAILYTALDDHGRLTDWLDALEINRAPLSGIWSPSLLLPTILAAKGKMQPRSLLLTQHGEYLRESYLMFEHVRFSRLVKIAPFALSARCAEEIPQLLNYLVAQRWIQSAHSIPIYIVVHPSQLELFRQALINLAAIKIELLDSHRLARYFKMQQYPPTDDVSPLIRHLLSTRPSISQFASRALRYNSYRNRWRTFNRSLVTVGCVVGLAFGVWQFMQLQSVKQQTQMLKEQVGNLAAAAQPQLTDVPTLPVPIEWIKDASDQKTRLEQRQNKGLDLWNQVFRAVKNTAGVVVVDQLTWKNDWQGDSFIQIDGSIVLQQVGGGPREAETAFLLFRQMLGNDYVINVLRSPSQADKSATGGMRYSLSVRPSRL